MRAFVLGAGEIFPSLIEEKAQNGDIVVCADKGYQNAKSLGLHVNVLVGDFDSLSEKLRTQLADRLHHRPDQDVNDLWKALTLAIERGAHEITVLGAFGRREDHSIGNLMLCATRMNDVDIHVVGDRGSFDFIDCDSRFESFAEQQVSLFTLSPSTEISTIGLRYEPPQNHLAAMWQGVSNESLGAEFAICTNGPTIVYRKF
jgi:thiamine pyrophosphokinase